MTFRSLLFPDDLAGLEVDALEVPACFGDLRLDTVVDAVTSGPGVDRLDLTAYFRAPLPTLDAVRYRQALFRDLARPPIVRALRRFAATMLAMREAQRHARWAGHRLEEQRWILATRERYCEAVTRLAADLGADAAAELGSGDRSDATNPGRDAAALPRTAGAPGSPALTALAAYLQAEVASGPFARLAADTERVSAALATVTYRLEISGTRIRVSRYEPGARPEADYGADVRSYFERFRQGARREFSFEVDEDDTMNPLEAEVAGRVARLFPDVFGALATYGAAHLDFEDATILRLDREVAFCLAWLDHAARLEALGLPISLPEVTEEGLEATGHDVFDLALASIRARDGLAVVTNDLDVRPGERIVVISGPNQGGKTTFARTVGQLHYLAALGLPVPGRNIRLGLVDRIHTHFEREEDLATLTSRLEEELLRIRDVLEDATPASLVVLNESFASTSLEDALAIGRDVLGRVRERGSLCIFVTFLDELAGDPGVVSLTSTVDPSDPAIRTFRVVRRPADGRAHADALARKHGLTEPELRERLRGAGAASGGEDA